MYIVNGITADAGWTKQIAISHDGANWSTINKSNLTVHSAAINKNSASPLASGGNDFVVVIKDGETEMAKFYLKDVKNQAGWTNDIAGLKQATDDISTWISL